MAPRTSRVSEQSLLERVLETRFTDGIYVDWDGLLAFLRHPAFPGREAAFKAELARAIRHHTISPEDFERLTALDQDSQADVDKFLLEELWQPLYPDEQPAE